LDYIQIVLNDSKKIEIGLFLQLLNCRLSLRRLHNVWNTTTPGRKSCVWDGNTEHV